MHPEEVEPKELSAERLEKFRTCGEAWLIPLLAHIAHLEQRLAEIERQHHGFLNEWQLQYDAEKERAEAAEQEAERLRKQVDHLFEFHHCNCDLEKPTK